MSIIPSWRAVSSILCDFCWPHLEPEKGCKTLPSCQAKLIHTLHRFHRLRISLGQARFEVRSPWSNDLSMRVKINAEDHVFIGFSPLLFCLQWYEKVRQMHRASYLIENILGSVSKGKIPTQFLRLGANKITIFSSGFLNQNKINHPSFPNDDPLSRMLNAFCGVPDHYSTYSP